MGKHRKPPARREKAPNCEEQRRYLRKLRQKQTHKPWKRPEEFPLGTGFAVLGVILGCIAQNIAERAGAAADEELLLLIFFLPFLVVPLICRLLRKKRPDSKYAERTERIDTFLCGALLLLLLLRKYISLMIEHFAA